MNGGLKTLMKFLEDAGTFQQTQNSKIRMSVTVQYLIVLDGDHQADTDLFDNTSKAWPSGQDCIYFRSKCQGFIWCIIYSIGFLVSNKEGCQSNQKQLIL